MTEIELSITRLAALGRSPYQIEVELGFPLYTIHQKYHAALQEGYARRSSFGDYKSKELTTAPAERTESQPKKKPAEQIKRQKKKTKEEIRKREKLAEAQQRYYQSHRSEVREKRRRYYLANKEKVAQYQRQYRQANREKVAEIRRKYNARKRQEKITQQGESAWLENQMPMGDQNGAGLK